MSGLMTKQQSGMYTQWRLRSARASAQSDQSTRYRMKKAWVRMKKATHCAHSEDSDQTGRMPRLILVFAGRTSTLLVLSRGGSNVYKKTLFFQLLDSG